MSLVADVNKIIAAVNQSRTYVSYVELFPKERFAARFLTMPSLWACLLLVLMPCMWSFFWNKFFLHDFWPCLCLLACCCCWSCPSYVELFLKQSFSAWILTMSLCSSLLLIIPHMSFFFHIYCDFVSCFFLSNCNTVYWASLNWFNWCCILLCKLLGLSSSRRISIHVLHLDCNLPWGFGRVLFIWRW